MIEIIQKVNNANKDAVLDRFLALGWGFKRLSACGDQMVSLHLVWPHEEPAKYPQISDLV